jgi:hypothetical protein
MMYWAMLVLVPIQLIVALFLVAASILFGGNRD